MPETCQITWILKVFGISYKLRCYITLHYTSPRLEDCIFRNIELSAFVKDSYSWTNTPKYLHVYHNQELSCHFHSIPSLQDWLRLGWSARWWVLCRGATRSCIYRWRRRRKGRPIAMGKWCLRQENTSQPYVSVEPCDNSLLIDWAWKVVCLWTCLKDLCGSHLATSWKKFGAHFPRSSSHPLPRRLVRIAALLSRYPTH